MKKIITSIGSVVFICLLVLMSNCSSPDLPAAVEKDVSAGGEISGNSFISKSVSSDMEAANEAAYGWLKDMQDLTGSGQYQVFS